MLAVSFSINVLNPFLNLCKNQNGAFALYFFENYILCSLDKVLIFRKYETTYKIIIFLNYSVHRKSDNVVDSIFVRWSHLCVFLFLFFSSNWEHPSSITFFSQKVVFGFSMITISFRNRNWTWNGRHTIAVLNNVQSHSMSHNIFYLFYHLIGKYFE